MYGKEVWDKTILYGKSPRCAYSSWSLRQTDFVYSCFFCGKLLDFFLMLLVQDDNFLLQLI